MASYLLSALSILLSLPACLYSALHTYYSTRSVSLSNTNLLSVPFVRTSFDSRSFSVAAHNLELSPSSSLNVYQAAVAKYCDEYICLSVREDISGTINAIFSSSAQDSLFPAGLPIRLTPSVLRL